MSQMPLSPRKQPRPSTSTTVLEQTDHNGDMENISMSLIAKNYCTKVMKGLHDLRKAGVLCDYIEKLLKSNFQVKIRAKI
jgi:hypothetical protein